MTGVSVKIKDVWRKYGSYTAVGGVTLDVQPGEFVSLLGPSGSGKTTLLMMLAGFTQPDSGRLYIGNDDVTDVPANKRNIAMVFQKYALFPHMTVAENVNFPLRMKKVDKSLRPALVRDAIRLVKLDNMSERRPAELSGGQQQRVALARAVVQNPRIILMDEPLGALDKKLRNHMQFELKQMQAKLGATVIYVTHDQEEALTMSDRVAVMNHGSIMQFGSPRELYDRPLNPFVADFLGEMNFVSGRVTGHEAERTYVTAGSKQIAIATDAHYSKGTEVSIAVRPELARIGRHQEQNGLEMTLKSLVFNGSHLVGVLELEAGTVFKINLPKDSPLASQSVGSRVSVIIPVDAHIYESERKDTN